MDKNPVQILNETIRPYSVSNWVAEFRKERGVSLPSWPEWCFMPMSGWYTVVSDAHKDKLDSAMHLPFELIPEVSKLSALGTWRYSQGIYRFDEDFISALTDTIIKGDIPVDVLYRLPEWCVYIETPGLQWLDDELYGFWSHLEYDINTKRTELRLLLHRKDFLTPIALHVGKWTITEAVDRATDESARQASKADIRFQKEADYVTSLGKSINPLVSMLLYLCSDEIEVDDLKNPGERPCRPSMVKTKKGMQLFPAEKPRVWSIGQGIGEKLRDIGYEGRKRGQGGNGGKKSPHIRGFHWHGYWKGPKASGQVFEYKWLAPIFVGSKVVDDDGKDF